MTDSQEQKQHKEKRHKKHKKDKKEKKHKKHKKEKKERKHKKDKQHQKEQPTPATAAAATTPVSAELPTAAPGSGPPMAHTTAAAADAGPAPQSAPEDAAPRRLLTPMEVQEHVKRVLFGSGLPEGLPRVQLHSELHEEYELLEPESDDCDVDIRPAIAKEEEVWAIKLPEGVDIDALDDCVMHLPCDLPEPRHIRPPKDILSGRYDLLAYVKASAKPTAIGHLQLDMEHALAGDYHAYREVHQESEQFVARLRCAAPVSNNEQKKIRSVRVARLISISDDVLAVSKRAVATATLWSEDDGWDGQLPQRKRRKRVAGWDVVGEKPRKVRQQTLEQDEEQYCMYEDPFVPEASSSDSESDEEFDEVVFLPQKEVPFIKEDQEKQRQHEEEQKSAGYGPEQIQQELLAQLTDDLHDPVDWEERQYEPGWDVPLELPQQDQQVPGPSTQPESEPEPVDTDLMQWLLSLPIMPDVAARQEEHIRYLATLDEQQHTALDQEQQAALDEEQQAAYNEQQRAALDEEQQAALDEQQQAALDEQQQAALDEQQQAALDEEQHAAYDEEQQAALDEEQQAALDEEQHAALDEEQHAAYDEEQQPQQERQPAIDSMQQEAEPELDTPSPQQQSYIDDYEDAFGDGSDDVPPPDEWQYSPVTPSPASQSPSGDAAGGHPSQEELGAGELDEAEQVDTAAYEELPDIPPRPVTMLLAHMDEFAPHLAQLSEGDHSLFIWLRNKLIRETLEWEELCEQLDMKAMPDEALPLLVSVLEEHRRRVEGRSGADLEDPAVRHTREQSAWLLLPSEGPALRPSYQQVDQGYAPYQTHDEGREVRVIPPPCPDWQTMDSDFAEQLVQQGAGRLHRFVTTQELRGKGFEWDSDPEDERREGLIIGLPDGRSMHIPSGLHYDFDSI